VAGVPSHIIHHAIIVMLTSQHFVTTPIDHQEYHANSLLVSSNAFPHASPFMISCSISFYYYCFCALKFGYVKLEVVYFFLLSRDKNNVIKIVCTS